LAAEEDYYPEEHDYDNFREIDEEDQAYLDELARQAAGPGELLLGPHPRTREN